MSITVTRRAGSMLAALVLLAALLLSTAGHADAATLYACKGKKDGKVRLVAKSKKCKKSEARISWSTTAGKGVKGDAGAKGDKGDKGDTGAKGDKGDKGDPGQPQSVVRFSASQGSTNVNNRVPLFTADGIDYSFNCGFVIILNVARIYADGPSGTSYAGGTLGRPTGINRLAADPWSANVFATLGGGAKPIAGQSTLADSEGSVAQYGVWTATVEGPTATTTIHARIDADGTCAVRGTATTIPNA